MSAIDLTILGMILDRPRSAYDIQKDVEDRHFSRWTKISTPSIYRRVIQLAEKGYLQSAVVKGEKAADKTAYFITKEGRAHFERLMRDSVSQEISLRFDFNVVIANLNKMEKQQALALLAQLRGSIAASAKANRELAATYAGLPPAGRTVFDQQRLLCDALLKWLDAFESEFRAN